MILIDGKNVASKLNIEIKSRIDALVEKGHRTPGLAIILVGDNPASLSYVKGKGRACDEVGMRHELVRLPETVTSEEVAQVIRRLNDDPMTDGMILQLPIPKHLDADMLIDLIRKDKDADGFHIENQGGMYQKRPSVKPATPKGIMTLLDAYGIDVSGKDAVVVGRSNIVGFPVARLLMDKNATVTVCHSRTRDLKAHTSKADILVVSAGKPRLITKDMVKEGAVVIDVGVNRVDGKLVGDVDFDAVKDVCSHITPVPGGVGPMTIHTLIDNTFGLYLDHIGQSWT
jgi:methylenetetrahydrofolate dehydrogenase (NADP+) / methenyltetrahydrofolate cyclohydrolase